VTENQDQDQTLVQMTIADDTAHLVLNRPHKMNALLPASYAALADRVTEASANDEVNIITVSGSGSAFSTGGDLTMLAKALRYNGESDIGSDAPLNVDMELTREFIRGASRAFTALEATPKVVIAAVNGTCQAGGLGIALCSDLIIAAENATFRTPEGLVGIADPFIPVRLARRIGTGRTRRMLFTAENVDARTAQEMGLVDDVVPPSQLGQAVDSLIERISETAPLARSLYKRVLNADLPPFDMSIALVANSSSSAKEGVDAFIARRPPTWPQDFGQ
jgi:enoyl-CoA hydratase